jgi:hypothetical protein
MPQIGTKPGARHCDPYGTLVAGVPAVVLVANLREFASPKVVRLKCWQGSGSPERRQEFSTDLRDAVMTLLCSALRGPPRVTNTQ